MDFTNQEHKENKERLGIKEYRDLEGKQVYYVKPSYGVHKVIRFDENKGLYFLELEGQKFWSNPFKILITE